MRSGKSDLLRVLSVVVVFLAASAVILRRVPIPFVWIWAIALPLSLYCAMRLKSEWLRRISLVWFGLAISLFLCEVGFVTFQRFRERGFQTTWRPKASFFVDDEELGYAPAASSHVTARMTKGGRLIYNVAYSITDRRVRATKGDSSGNTWLFMGCSFAFGEGVNDDETFPAFFSAASGYHENVVNLGFSGYGPHQMLRALETDRVRPLIHGAVRQIVYEGIWAHPGRIAGRDHWDLYGPAYRMSGTGVTYTGPFHGRAVGVVLKMLRRSGVFLFVDQTLLHPPPNDDDIELYGRIVERSAQLAKQKYDAEFTVLYWDDNNDHSRRVLARLKKTGLPLILVSGVIPEREWRRGMLLADGHPRPEANRRLAAALAARFGIDTAAKH